MGAHSDDRAMAEQMTETAVPAARLDVVGGEEGADPERAGINCRAGG